MQKYKITSCECKNLQILYKVVKFETPYLAYYSLQTLLLEAVSTDAMSTLFLM